jgi:hypothetical protein
MLMNAIANGIGTAGTRAHACKSLAIQSGMGEIDLQFP